MRVKHLPLTFTKDKKIMKDDYNDIYFVLIIGIASFLVILGTGIYSTLRYGNF